MTIMTPAQLLRTMAKRDPINAHFKGVITCNFGPVRSPFVQRGSIAGG